MVAHEQLQRELMKHGRLQGPKVAAESGTRAHRRHFGTQPGQPCGARQCKGWGYVEACALHILYNPPKLNLPRVREGAGGWGGVGVECRSGQDLIDILSLAQAHTPPSRRCLRPMSVPHRCAPHPVAPHVYTMCVSAKW